MLMTKNLQQGVESSTHIYNSLCKAISRKEARQQIWGVVVALIPDYPQFVSEFNGETILGLGLHLPKLSEK